MYQRNFVAALSREKPGGIAVFGIGLLAALALAGCGGGATSPASGTSRRIAVLVTDSFREDYDHVWTTLYKAELLPQSGAPVTLFDDAAGRLIDVKTLRDAAGARYSFLADAVVPAGTYTGVRITIGAQMQLFLHGSSAGQAVPVVATLPRDAVGHPRVDVTFSAPRSFGAGDDDVVVDFDLAHFLVQGGVVIPALKEGSRSGLDDPARQEHEDYHGVVRELAGVAPNQTFLLQRGHGMTFLVNRGTDTAIYGAGALQNGSSVEVQGRYDAVARRFVASSIEVRHADEEDSPEVKGIADEIQAVAGTFTVTLEKAHGIAPSQTSIRIVTTGATVFRTDRGQTMAKEAFFAQLAVTPRVEVEGSYDAIQNILTAKKVKFEDESHDSQDDQDDHQGNDAMLQ